MVHTPPDTPQCYTHTSPYTHTSKKQFQKLWRRKRGKSCQQPVQTLWTSLVFCYLLCLVYPAQSQERGNLKRCCVTETREKKWVGSWRISALEVVYCLLFLDEHRRKWLCEGKEVLCLPLVLTFKFKRKGGKTEKSEKKPPICMLKRGWVMEEA